jgi:UDP-N-acetylglucosamine--N-acetylmuramyl-(pentapeptide) pyrophosphoryl-undecaprenol N-acetylglucosamine transferase
MLRGARAIFQLAAGILQARALLRRLRPAAVIGFGGYPSIAPVLGASLLRERPAILLHEQNAVLGRANRFLARFAGHLALGFAGTAGIPAGIATVVTGNPVRPAIKALANTPYMPPGDRINLLVLGGSLGARVFSDIVPGAVARLPEALRARLHIVQQCRMEDLPRVRGSYQQAAVEAELAPFFTGIAEHYAAAHLVISRAGASSCAEIALVGRPAILVPLPGAIDDHQSANARALAEAGAAVVLAQSAFSITALAALLAEQLAAPASLAAAAQAARSCARPEAAEELAALVDKIMPAWVFS